jgi:hypothetical protein
VTREWASKAYGVVIEGDGDSLAVDQAATEQRRSKIVSERLAGARPWEGDGDGGEPADTRQPPDGQVSEYVAIKDGRYFAGDVELGSAGGNYKLGALVRDLPLTEGNPELQDPALYVDQEVAFRQIVSPTTGRLLQTEIVVDGAPPQWDLRPGLT